MSDKLDMAREAAGSAWQPIETAPRDCPVLLFERGFLEIFAGRYSTYHCCWLPMSGNDRCSPTHWMPLPSPPALAGERGGEG